MNIEVLKQNGKFRTFQAKDEMCREGELGETVYLLLRGEAVVYMNTNLQNERMPIGKILEGTFFGESALLEGMKREASVVATGDQTIVLAFEYKRFQEIIERENVLAYKLLRTLLSRIDGVMDTLISKDPAYVFQCRTDDIYSMVSSLDVETFTAIVTENREYTITAVKALCEMLRSSNKRLLS
ncbi:Crp/Fnr family transcriptional regulator [Anaerosporobacter faecicola]|uniref:Crp/Fnr family transcriptional regulator n=1 Tax=Anaerosporobacter faecicola TaxID=2718714 RepID=UPI00143C274A|nr:cyclic nucleotide-binding domain-containing protein [Anaerosporobacter faecicola]